MTNKVFILIKADYDRRENIGVFTTQEKAKAYQTAIEMGLFDSGSAASNNLCGISFIVEEWETE